MNMQQMMIQAQKLQRELKKAKDELRNKDFITTVGGAVSVTMKGDFKVSTISIDEDAFDKENKEMVEEMISMAINELIEKIKKAEEDIEESITGRAGGFGF